MDDFVRRLLALRHVLRRNAMSFHDLMESNERSIEPDSVGKVRDLIEASMNTIEDMPINPPDGSDAPR